MRCTLGDNSACHGEHAETFVDLSMMRRPLPFAGGIASLVLSEDCDPDFRLLRVASDTAEVAHELLMDLKTARRLVSRAGAALVEARSTSRAPAVFALIAGLGLVTRGQVGDAFKMTAAGADGVLARLLAAELIVRRPGRAGRFCVAPESVATLASSAAPLGDAQDTSGAHEVDVAMADLDRLLARPPV